MKTIRVSDETHKKLTGILGKLTAETGKMQTYEDVINALITQSLRLKNNRKGMRKNIDNKSIQNFFKNFQLSKHDGKGKRSE